MWTTPRRRHENRGRQGWKYLKVQTIISILVAKILFTFSNSGTAISVCFLFDDVQLRRWFFCALYLPNKWSTSYWSREVTVTSSLSVYCQVVHISELAGLNQWLRGTRYTRGLLCATWQDPIMHRMWWGHGGSALQSQSIPYTALFCTSEFSCLHFKCKNLTNKNP